jgi:exopolyphosphatase/guanosine-5'-triphosphate,3'-diphosphate pyrophosphatase
VPSGPDFGAAEDAFAALTPGPVQESDELYLLSPADQNVKVRDGLMDIKLLREVDADGLERWEPVMKQGFPLSAAEVSRVLDTLGVPPPARSRDPYTLDQLLAELLEPSGAVRAVRVHKRRARYTLGGCGAELADLEVDGQATRTLAIESEDRSAVIAAVRGAGLDGHANTSYPRGLAALLGAAPHRYAVIDVGTNSVKFHIGERDAAGRWRAIVDRAELTRLGEHLEQTGTISPEPLERTVAAIAGMVEEARRHQVRATAAVGTAGLRIASKPRRRHRGHPGTHRADGRGDPGEEESRLAYLAVRAGLGRDRGLAGRLRHRRRQHRVHLRAGPAGRGALQLRGRRGPLHRALRARRRGGPEVLDDALAAIAADLARLDGRPAGLPWWGWAAR